MVVIGYKPLSSVCLVGSSIHWLTTVSHASVEVTWPARHHMLQDVLHNTFQRAVFAAYLKAVCAWGLDKHGTRPARICCIRHISTSQWITNCEYGASFWALDTTFTYQYTDLQRRPSPPTARSVGMQSSVALRPGYFRRSNGSICSFPLAYTSPSVF